MESTKSRDKSEEVKAVRVRPFKNQENLFWMGYKVYQFYPNTGVISINGGGISEQDHIDKLKKYLKRKNKL